MTNSTGGAKAIELNIANFQIAYADSSRVVLLDPSAG